MYIPNYILKVTTEVVASLMIKWMDSNLSSSFHATIYKLHDLEEITQALIKIGKTSA